MFGGKGGDIGGDGGTRRVNIKAGDRKSLKEEAFEFIKRVEVKMRILEGLLLNGK